MALVPEILIFLALFESIKGAPFYESNFLALFFSGGLKFV
jgi:hypothetical protein